MERRRGQIRRHHGSEILAAPTSKRSRERFQTEIKTGPIQSNVIYGGEDSHRSGRWPGFGPGRMSTGWPWGPSAKSGTTNERPETTASHGGPEILLSRKENICVEFEKTFYGCRQ